MVRGAFSSAWCCTGCNCETYWSEWHNDPPRCCDPCDRCGNYVGTTGYRAPYNHPYSVGPNVGYVSRNTARPTQGTVARKPQMGVNKTYQR